MTYYGVQYGAYCYGGTDLRKAVSYGQSTDCNIRCPNNKNQFCGGGWANSLYAMVY